MSRKGNKPIMLPSGVSVSMTGRTFEVKGPKGSLSGSLFDGMTIVQEAQMLSVVAEGSSRDVSRLHGLQYALLSNMVIGVASGFEKRLEMVGVGYRASVQGTDLDVQVGFSHPTKLAIPTDLKVVVEKNTVIVVSGIDKQRVGQFAAEIRSLRRPEPYQGKGIRYVGEYVRRKAGKAAKSAKK